ncbi:hypothetical protein ACFWPQ_18240 [Streptomyces sp. NPDC058464]|uniref:hypothetical protein n=1 Tax=Streptomyces sp. NPDC058464 TaxID=3346511 RepID=UPI003658F71A
MGVFARFLGKKPKASEEPDTKVPAGAEPDGPGPEDVAADAAEEAAEAATKGSGEDDGRGADARTETERTAVAADSTEIPKQQSAKEAADNEAGEGART